MIYVKTRLYLCFLHIQQNVQMNCKISVKMHFNIFDLFHYLTTRSTSRRRKWQKQKISVFLQLPSTVRVDTVVGCWQLTTTLFAVVVRGRGNFYINCISTVYSIKHLYDYQCCMGDVCTHMYYMYVYTYVLKLKRGGSYIQQERKCDTHTYIQEHIKICKEHILRSAQS